MKNNKKYAVIGLIALIIILLIISSFTGAKDKEDKTMSNDPEVIYENAQKESAAVKDNEKREFVQIDINQYFEKYNGSENTIVLIARPTCHYCQIAEPIIQNIMYKYDFDINYLNTDNFKEGDEESLTSSNEYFSSGLGTPTLLVVGNGTIVGNVGGLTDEAHYIEFFKQNGYIK